ncbi:MAG: hypothetical protein M3371_13820 [Acidobacteriota bacterium]|nr:hypothetical protein [Acidobacteriota bacterium]
MWLGLPSLKGKSVRHVEQFDIESAKITRRRSLSRYGEPVQPQTVNRELIIMSSLFHRAVEWGYRVVNPCKGVARLPVKPAPPRSLTADETQALLKAAWAGRLLAVPHHGRTRHGLAPDRDAPLEKGGR